MNIKVENLRKEIKGNIILDEINLDLEAGKIYGFVGKNGSGKTMLFRTLSGLILPSEGKVLIDGKELHKELKGLPSIGLVIENVGLYPEFTGFKNLSILAKIKGIANAEDIEKAIIRVGLYPKDKRTVRKYSLGMKQRIVLAQAIMEKPDIIMLDEPTNALDDEGVNLIRGIIQEEKERGALILIASHNKEDIELLCDKTYIMSKGRIESEVAV